MRDHSSGTQIHITLSRMYKAETVYRSFTVTYEKKPWIKTVLKYFDINRVISAMLSGDILSFGVGKNSWSEFNIFQRILHGSDKNICPQRYKWVTQWVGHWPSMQKPWIWYPELYKSGVVIYAYVVEAEGFRSSRSSLTTHYIESFKSVWTAWDPALKTNQKPLKFRESKKTPIREAQSPSGGMGCV